MSSKSLTVKDLAEKYGVSAKLIAAELVRQGVEVNKAEKTKIPEDMTDLIESFFDDLYGQQDDEALLPKGGKRSNAPKKGSSRREEGTFKDNSHKSGLSSSNQEQTASGDGNTITFQVTAYDEAGKIGEGTHKRAVISSQRFLDKVYSKL